MAPMDRACKTDEENGILYYARMCGSRDIEVWKLQKMLVPHLGNLGNIKLLSCLSTSF